MPLQNTTLRSAATAMLWMLWIASLAKRAGAQAASPSLTAVTAGSDAEQYLRLGQISGIVPVRPWSIRAFGPAETDSMLQARTEGWFRTISLPGSQTHGVSWAFSPVEARVAFNSGFPYGWNDGPTWTGRGLTLAAQGGVAARYRKISAALNPMFFIAQNARVTTVGNLRDDALNPAYIDLPQRFGTGSYGRLDPGESYIRADIGFVGAGFSTAAEVWGPGVDHPLILGTNAPGVPRVFLGSSHPLDLRVVTVHGRFEWGRLEGSGYESAGVPDRMMVSGIGTMSFPLVPGLELGAIRFFHTRWPDNGLSHAPFFRVFEGLLKRGLANDANPSGDSDDNQLASMFFRWVFPRSRFEMYGEFGREDHSWNLRDFWEEPDHDSAFLLGLIRTWGDSLAPSVVRVEHLNTRISHLAASSMQTPWYLHTRLTQGHTNRGQILGDAFGAGGGATSVVVEKYRPDGRTTLRWDRLMRGEQLDAVRLPIPGNADVMQAVGVQWTRVRGRGDLSLGLTAVMDLNRNFQGDAFNLNAMTGFRFYPGRLEP